MKDFPEDLLPQRETKIETPTDLADKNEEVFAVCLQTDDIDLLIPLKIYQITLRGQYARVIDEKGEPAVYPINFFLPLQLTPDASDALEKAYAQVS